MKHCQNTGLGHRKPYLSLKRSGEVRAQIDQYIEQKMKEWNATVPFAQHFEGDEIHQNYYRRNLIETALRIRLLRVSESKALAEIAKISPEAAQIWANYECEEMIHDKLFADDLVRSGGCMEDLLQANPYLSTKLLTGFFSYLLDHEGPLGVVAYSYLVEYVNVKIDPDKIKGMKRSLGEEKIKGQISHTHTDLNDDHPGEVWAAIRYLIADEDDIQSIYTYIDQHQEILAMYFREIYQDIVLNQKKSTLKLNCIA